MIDVFGRPLEISRIDKVERFAPMKWSLLLSAMLLPTAAFAQPTIDILTPDAASQLMCTDAQSWCLGADKDGPFASSRTMRAETHLWDLPDVPANLSKATFLPQLIRREEDRAIVGVIVPEERAYSGGGFMAKTLYLFDVTLGDHSQSNYMGTIPLSSEISIRACFGESDSAKRREACHDQYSFDTDLKLVPVNGGMPDIQVQTKATRYPKDVSRRKDSSTRPALKQSDLVEQVDRTCSYQARYRFDAELPGYVADKPLPDCSEFLNAVP